MPTTLLIWLIPLPPLLAFGMIVLWANRSHRLSTALAVGAMTVSWALGLVVFAAAVGTEHLGAEPFASSIPWLPLGTEVLRIGVLIDPLSAITLFFVVWTCLAIFVYSIGYHHFGKPRDPQDQPGLPPHAGGVDPLYARFFAFISLFAFGMLTLVVSDNLLLLFIGWEIMGLCSYLLIGFWFGKESAKKAMVKAFITTRIGDVFMLLGMLALFTATGTLSFTEILRSPETLNTLAATPSGILGLSLAALIGLLLFAGTVGKSAQFPLHVWLPDAMEGPTPISAMIHAATMVSAGIYLILRFFPLLTVGWHPGQPLTTTMLVISAVGAFTALFASTIAVAQNDIKRVLAYSTISQLGYMVAAVGVGAFVAATFHLVTHAFFKALLFLGSGSVIHGMEHGQAASSKNAARAMPGQAGPAGAHATHDHVDPQDMLNMGGLRRRMPWTFWTFLIGGLALAGFPIITAGFWSKDEILSAAFDGHLLVFVLLALAALLTALYVARQVGLTFLGKPRSAAAENAHESSRVMLAPLVLLSVFSIAAGWAGIHNEFPLIGGWIPNWVEEFVAGALATHPEPTPFAFPPLLTSLVVSLGGLTLGFLIYRRLPRGAVDPLARWLGPVHTLLRNKVYFDELYAAVFVRPAYWFGETFVYAWTDRKVIDGALHGIARLALTVGALLRRWIDLMIVNGFGDLVGGLTKGAGRSFRVVQSGKVQAYLAAGLLFAGLMISFLLLVRP
jgi:NADH-quinone oxidoreductase subunit L